MVTEWHEAGDGTKSVAVYSHDFAYRYMLRRRWDATKVNAAFVLLNPSTATAECDDPTVRRCIRYAKKWNYGSATILNLFAYRATVPHVMKMADDPVGPLNDWVIASAIRDHALSLLVIGWGVHGAYLNRGWQM